MKILILLFCAVPFLSAGQSTIMRTPQQENVYLNIKNPILFKLCNRSKKDFFKTTNGTIDFIHDTLFVTPKSRYDPTVITIYRGDLTHIVTQFSFKSVMAGVPTIDHSDTTYSASERVLNWKNAKRLKLMSPDNLSHLKTDTCSGILSFRITVVSSKGDYDETYTSNSDTIPSAVTAKINSLPYEAYGECYWIKVHEIRVYAKWLSDDWFYLNDFTEAYYY